jgi:hypothetical protein
VALCRATQPATAPGPVQGPARAPIGRTARPQAASPACCSHGLEQGDAAGDGLRASAGSCASANWLNRTYAAAMSGLLQGQPAGLHGAVSPPNPMQAHLSCLSPPRPTLQSQRAKRKKYQRFRTPLKRHERNTLSWFLGTKKRTPPSVFFSEEKGK